MKKQPIKFNCKKIKHIPKQAVGSWLVLGLLSIFCLIQLLRPPLRELDRTKDRVIFIDKVYLRDSHDTKGSRIKLELISDGITYYLWYPQSSYAKFSDKVENELLSGSITSVRAKIAEQSFRDLILNQNRIVDLRSYSSVYYDLNTEKTNLQQNYNVIATLFGVMLFLWLFYTLLILLVYHVLAFK